MTISIQAYLRETLLFSDSSGKNYKYEIFEPNLDERFHVHISRLDDLNDTQVWAKIDEIYLSYVTKSIGSAADEAGDHFDDTYRNA